MADFIFPKTFDIFGLSIDIYRGFYVLGFLTIFIFNTVYGKKFKIKPTRAFLLTLSSYLLIFAWAYVLSWVESLFSDWGHHNAVRVYIWMPLLLFLLAKPFRVKWRTACDFIAPSACIVYGIARIGCLFPGCCYGVPFEWGIYSHAAEAVVFPVQLCEALSSLLLGVLAIVLNKKKKYNCDAKTYFIMLIPYGLIRFGWEFLADNEKVFMNISSLALHALLMTVVGIIMLIVLNKADKKNALKESEDNTKINV